MAFGEFGGGFAPSGEKQKAMVNPFADRDVEFSEFVLLEDGIYPYTVRGWSPSRYGGGEKMEACEIAVIDIDVEGPAGNANIKHRIYMTEANEWRVAQLFKSAGFPTVNGKVKIRWSELAGKKGSCEVKKVAGNKDGVYFNNITKFR